MNIVGWRWGRLAALCGVAVATLWPTAAAAQLSLGTAVDLALRNNPRVLSAQADVARAQAALTETHDVYIPTVSFGAGLGQAYGYLPNPPTLFTLNSGSLVYAANQMSYIRSARAGLHASQLSLQDIREAVAQDTALAYIALDHSQQRAQVVKQQADFANNLVKIVQERLDAGQDTQIGLTQSKLTAAQLRLAALRAQDETENDREHLARLMGVPPTSMTIDGRFPERMVKASTPIVSPQYANLGVASAFANAEAKLQQAKGDAKFLYRPQVNLVVQYNRYATFTNSFGQLESFSNSRIPPNEYALGVQITLPFLDRYRTTKGRESAADAAKALHDAQNAQLDALDGQTRTRHTIAELQAQQDVAALQQQLAQQQLDALRVQLQSGTGNPNGQQMTPKDEVNAQIGERDKYLAVIDATYQLRQAEIQLLRQQDGLENWLKAAVTGPQPVSGAAPNTNLPPNPTPQP